MQCKMFSSERFNYFLGPLKWGQFEGVIHTGSNYANFVWLMNFTVCLFVSLPLQVWLLHLPFFSPVFWVLDTYKVLYSQFLTQALLDFITEILCQTKRRLCWPLFASYEWLTPSTQCNFFFSSSNPSDLNLAYRFLETMFRIIY